MLTGIGLYGGVQESTHEWGFQSRNPESRDPGRFPNPEIPGLSRCQSRDFGIIKFYLLNLFYTFSVNITH